MAGLIAYLCCVVKAKEGEFATEVSEVTEEEAHAKTGRRKEGRDLLTGWEERVSCICCASDGIGLLPGLI